MTDRIDALSALLSATEEAHGAYETTELNGVYDEDWATWYAAEAVRRGIGEIVGHPVTTARLAEFLGSSFLEFKRADPKPSEGWAAYTARRIAEEL